MSRPLVPFLAGLVFALGLGISGMTQPAKVIGFLDLSGHWDASLAFVMAGAVAANLLLVRFGPRLLGRMARAGGAAASASAPGRAPLGVQLRAALRDRRLLAGSAAFGVGWGLVGFCPGPAIVALATGHGEALVFFGAMGLGMLAYRAAPALWARLRGQPAVRLPGPAPRQECGMA